MKMKTTTLIGSVALMAGLLAASSARATTTLTFTENGGATAPFAYYSGISPMADPNVPVTDPSTLVYLAAIGNVAGAFGGANDVDAHSVSGWLAIYAYGYSYGTDPTGDKTLGLLNLINFDNSYESPGGTGQPPAGLYQRMFWFSQEGTGSLADNWLDSTAVSGILAGSNDGGVQFTTENSAGLASYTPASGQPGADSDNSGTQYTYDFQSSVIPVPEASTIIAGALLVLPFGASTLRILRRNRMA